jgi:hypothetical protein
MAKPQFASNKKIKIVLRPKKVRVFYEFITNHKELYKHMLLFILLRISFPPI